MNSRWECGGKAAHRMTRTALNKLIYSALILRVYQCGFCEKSWAW